MGKPKIVITCEHAGFDIPKNYKYIFDKHQQVLMSHRGWDIGAFDMAGYLSKTLKATLIHTNISRLLVETNRSEDHQQLFSEFTTPLSRDVKNHLINTYYRPYRLKVKDEIGKQIEAHQCVLHLSIHSFTPYLYGEERIADIGLLFDEQRLMEANFCESWKNEIERMSSPYKIMFNYPYRGADDGLTTYLRSVYHDGSYLGVEVEINQKYANTPDFTLIKYVLSESLEKVKMKNLCSCNH